MAKRPTDLRNHPEYQRRQAARQRQTAQDAERDAELGRQAFQDFSQFRGKLALSDREIIARNLYWAVEGYYESHPDEERYLLLKDAGVTDQNSTKVLARLVLRPGEPISANNPLYASPEKYRWLIEAIARCSEESVHALAGRVLIGTGFYPRRPEVPQPRINEAHLILAALQKAADRVDAEFDLYEQCLEVARLRDELESTYWAHVRETGQVLDYQAWQLKNPALRLPSPCGPEHVLAIDEDNALWWPLDPDYLNEWNAPQDSFRLIVPQNPYWAKGDSPSDQYAAGVVSGKDFFYFPHVYLGPALCWANRNFFDEASYAEIPLALTPVAYWDEDTCRYSLRERDTQLGAAITREYEWDELSSLTAHWLVMYPDPLLKRLVPMLYALGESRGAQLTQLTASAIADLGNPERSQYFGDDAPTLLQRLKNATGYLTGDFEVYDAWRETAARFHWNPVLRKHPEAMDEIRYRKHLQRWIGQRPVHADDSDDEE